MKPIEIRVVDKLNTDRVADLVSLYGSSAWWATQRTRPDVEKMLTAIVEEDYRGRGLGRRVMDEILARPELRNVNSIELVCQPDLVPFYERWGFTDRVGRSLLMRRTANPTLVATI